ncbi:MAG: 50S ribosomal protein L6 [Saprospiraceae bacterium]
MARIGKIPVSLPKDVKVALNNNEVTVTGPKGQLMQSFSPEISIVADNNQVVVSRPSDQRRHKELHGLVRALVNNMVVGVSTGFSRDLVIQGVGYRAVMEGKNLVLSVGYSHPVVFEPIEDVYYEVEKGGRNLSVKGINKELVGEIAARIRKTRPPEPYKGKGIRYKGEVVRRKAGKSGKAK